MQGILLHICHDNAVPVLLSVGLVPRGQWWANIGWHWHLAVTPADTGVTGKYCTYSNSEPHWLLIGLLRLSGTVDIHSFQLDLGEKGNKHVGRLLGTPWICLTGICSTYSPPNLLFKCYFPEETETILGWVDFSDLFQEWIVPSHSWLNLLFGVCGWVEWEQMKQKSKLGPCCSRLRVRRASWDFPCSLNRGDHLHESLLL